MVLYVGIADALGLDAFGKEGEVPVGFLQLRANANRHRFAMVFRINASKAEGEKIEKMFRQDAKKALIYIKKLVKDGKADLALEKGQAKKHWHKLPDEDLVW